MNETKRRALIAKAIAEHVMSGNTVSNPQTLEDSINTALSSSLVIDRFPLDYKGWTINIKMGKEFKGARGSVRNKRGYSAVRNSDGKVIEYAPSYDVSPSLSGIKVLIDVQEKQDET